MFGPRIGGDHGIELPPPTLEDYEPCPEWTLHRTHNQMALANQGSWRANQKSGYSQIGTYPRSWFRSGEWFDEWLGEAFPNTFPAENLPSPWRDQGHPK